MAVKFKVTSHAKEALDESDKAIYAALLAVGIQAEGHAVKNLSHTPKRIDTGLLVNSITCAMGGETAQKQHYQSNDHDKHGKPIEVKRGDYSGTAPTATDGSESVWIGTNVEYATYVHDGTQKMAANRFLRDAVTKHAKEYREIVKQHLEKG